MLAYLLILLCCPLDGPPVTAADLRRFPQTVAVGEWGWTQAVRNRDRVRETGTARHLAEAERVRRAWDVLDDCLRIHPHCKVQTKTKLVELRELIGKRNFAFGQMPLPWTKP